MRWDRPSNRQPFLVLRDWDDDDGVACVPALIDKVRGDGPGSRVLAVRIAVRSVDPKGAVLQACSRSPSNIRKGMLPRVGSGRRVGPEYAAFVVEFGRDHWDPSQARTNSPSLHRSILRLEALVADALW